MVMIRTALVLTVCALAWQQDPPAKPTGSLTIYTVPKSWNNEAVPGQAWPKYASPGMYCEPGRLSLSIDQDKPLAWPTRERATVENLNLDKKHMVRIYCGSKPLQSFRFRFSEFNNTHLCLAYDVLGGPQLFDRTKHGWGCK